MEAALNYKISITFIGRLNALDYTKHRIVCDPSSGSIKLYLTEIRSGSLMFVVFLVGVWQRNFEPVVCVCVRYDGLGTSSQSVVPYTHKAGSKLRGQTPTKHTINIREPLRISVKYSSILPYDGSHTILNMSELFLILCTLKFIQRRF